MNGQAHECRECGRMTAEEGERDCEACIEAGEAGQAEYRREHDYGAER